MQFLCQLGSYGTGVHFLLEKAKELFDLEQEMFGCGRSNRQVRTQAQPSIHSMLELEPTLLVLLGVIDYGKGKIILNPCYHVDDDNAFSDMLFYNMIIMAAKGQW
jgi:hypothetical protein